MPDGPEAVAPGIVMVAMLPPIETNPSKVSKFSKHLLVRQ
jgi:hypothetical protein